MINILIWTTTEISLSYWLVAKFSNSTMNKIFQGVSITLMKTAHYTNLYFINTSLNYFGIMISSSWNGSHINWCKSHCGKTWPNSFSKLWSKELRRFMHAKHKSCGKLSILWSKLLLIRIILPFSWCFHTTMIQQVSWCRNMEIKVNQEASESARSEKQVGRAAEIKLVNQHIWTKWTQMLSELGHGESSLFTLYV